MEREIQWIKSALLADRKKTQKGLAAAMQLDPGSVSRLLRGERRLKFSEARLAAEYLGVEPPEELSETGGGYTPETASTQKTPDYAPLYSVTAEKGGFWSIDRNIIVEKKRRAPQFEGVPSAFGFYVPDNIMAPRFKTGEIAWINPARPVKPGDDILLVSKQEVRGRALIVLCELAEQLKTKFRVLQHAGASAEYPVKDWAAMHVFGRL